jgi:hypothetical protein
MNVSDYWREQSRKRRLKARESGRCIICMTREARSGRVTCERCCAAATAATKRRRSTPRTADVRGQAQLAQESASSALNGAA